jgi:DNA-binding NtrC family response regulator
MERPDSTLTLRPGRRREPRTTRDPHILVALDCNRPLDPCTRCSLTDAGSATFGRAPDRRIAFIDDPSGKFLDVGLPDGWMSKVHARFCRVGEHWMIEDAHSKNGTFVNALPIERALLSPGDLIELGRTVLLYGDAAPPADELQPVLDSTQLKSPLPGFPTWSPAFARALADLEAVARSDVPIVIRGESGTGKELIARAIHQVSGRRGPILAVNCAAISEKLVESELFGYRKGAFTGAEEDRPGLFRSADSGTLLLDEIGDLPEQAQGTLLRVLQEQEVVPVGAARPIKVDVRVVAATQVDLKALAAESTFRRDLIARLAGHTLELPPLRERREDLSLLIPSLLRRIAPEHAHQVSFTPAAARALFTYDWPLNVRELEHALRVAVVLARGRPVELEHLPDEVRAARPHTTKASAESSFVPRRPEELRRREQLVELLRKHKGNVSAVARAIGKTRAQVHRWIRRYALDTHGFRR